MLLQRARQLGLAETDRPDLLLVSDRQTPILCGQSAILVGQLFTAANRRLDELPASLRDPAEAAEPPGFDGLWGNFAFFFSCARGKGAYREPREIAHQDMPAIRERFRLHMRKLLLSGRYPAIATHDDELISATRAFATEASRHPVFRLTAR